MNQNSKSIDDKSDYIKIKYIAVKKHHKESQKTSDTGKMFAVCQRQL